MEKLQELLKWISEQDKFIIEDLYGLLIEEDIYYLNRVLGKERYKELKQEIIEEYEYEKGNN